MSSKHALKGKSVSYQAAASDMPDMRQKNIVMGFWHNWAEGEWSGSGYQQGYFKNLQLTDIPAQYNVIAVAFMKVDAGSTDPIPTFKPHASSDEEFRRQVDMLNAQGRAVLISLGGADAHIELQSSDEDALVARIIYLVETYGFDGLDIDLEQAAIIAKDNQVVIPAALRRVKAHYREQGKHFIISMAPEFPYLRVGNSYEPYITSLEDDYDFIAPQFYNQGADGVWVDVLGNLKQNDDAVKEDFLYYLTESIVTGTRGYVKIPSEKFVIGLPSNNDAANNGYVIDSQAVTRALERLALANLPIKGLMTWSINWDDGRPKVGAPYAWEFITRYGYISGGETPVPDKPTAPTGLVSTTVTTSAVTLSWGVSTGPHPITHYLISRDGQAVGQISAPPYTDSGLAADRTYAYRIVAVDSLQTQSDPSTPLTVKTLALDPVTPEWLSSVWYRDHDSVTYQGLTYICVMQHTSNPYWTPALASSLWLQVSRQIKGQTKPLSREKPSVSSYRSSTIISRSPVTRHGHIFSPPSRAYLAWASGQLDEGALNQREGGKFFPSLTGGMKDAYAPDDDMNAAPPPDGKIASANQLTGAMLDAPGSDWQKHDVRGAEILDVVWRFVANHVTRRWNYFITKVDWNPSLPLSRAQFEPQPFYTVQFNQQPHWAHANEMQPPTPTTHEVLLPQRTGYHVLLAVWEVANTAMGFYQVVDLNFLPAEGGEDHPTTPTGLAASDVTDKQVKLSWNAATGVLPIAFYRITRNGTTRFDIEAPLLTWTDRSVIAQTDYAYFITAIDENGNLSAPSRAIDVRVPAEGGEDAPPSAPANLHSMAQTTSSISLMWGASSGPLPLSSYLVYRDGTEVQRVSPPQTSWDDRGLTPDTQYRYFVAALDQSGKLSVPGNVLTIKTKVDEGGGTEPQWQLNAYYATGALVGYSGQTWRCLQAHTAYTEDWAPGKAGSETLWVSA